MKEISLAIDMPDGVVLVVGCSHPTIETIVEATKAALNKPIHLVMGGLHLLPANDQDIRRTATACGVPGTRDSSFPITVRASPALRTLEEVFADHYLYAGVKKHLQLGPR